VRKIGFSILVIVALFLLTFHAVGAQVGTSDQQVKAVAEPILNSLMKGFNQGDYAQFSKNFDKNLRETINEKKFEQVRGDLLKRLGKYKSKKYLGFLNQEDYTIVLYKGAFADTKNDMLIKLVLKKSKDKVSVAGLWFQ
jgi:hypothetical protein